MSRWNPALPRPTRRAVAAALALAVLVPALGACGEGEPTTATSVTAAESGRSDLDEVTVTGAVGSAPAVEVPAPFSVPAFERKVLVEGDGAQVEPGQQVTVEYVGVNGTDGNGFDSSYARDEAATFTLEDSGALLPGIVKAVDGLSVGSRVLAAVPPSDGYGIEGMAALGIGPTDTLVFVVDVVAVKAVLTRAEGTVVPPKAGLPTVTLAADGTPSVTLPSTTAPTTLVIQPLIAGAGAKVSKGQQVTVHYTGVIWPGGAVFDSSWDRKESVRFTVGVGKLIQGWDVGLVGQTVGSQVLLVVPPDKGYGAQGNANAGITGTDTLVFVVDILDAATAAP